MHIPFRRRPSVRMALDRRRHADRAPHTDPTDDWLRAEFEWAWTTQSDINARIVSVYTAAMTVSIALITAIAGWLMSADVRAMRLDPGLTCGMFALPVILIIPLYWHNIGQRREIVRIGAYWKVLIDGRARRSTWATRVERYREVIEDEAFAVLRGESNDPVSMSYWTVFAACVVGAIVNYFSSLSFHPSEGSLVLVCERLSTATGDGTAQRVRLFLCGHVLRVRLTGRAWSA